MSKRNRVVTAGLMMLICSDASFAQQTQPSSAGQAPQYPHTDLAISYQVDPSWPQRPDGLTWSDVPGVSVDANDHIWVFTRADVPVQEYDVAGKFIQSWGKGLIKRAHRLRFDQQG